MLYTEVINLFMRILPFYNMMFTDTIDITKWILFILGFKNIQCIN